MTLREKFIELYRDSESYYYENVPKYNSITNPDKSLDFIKDYFIIGSKFKAFDLSFEQEFMKKGKHVHTVSMYFLGILLRKLVEDELVGKSNSWKLQDDQEGYLFTYTWFLSSLFHDTASVIEDKNDCLAKYDAVNSDDYFYYTLHDYKIANNPYDIEDLEKKYAEDLIKKYFYYIHKRFNKVEHGVLGGFLLFDRLMKNYDEQWKGCIEKDPQTKDTKDSFVHNARSWRIEDHKHYAYVADVIIAHNIWHGSATNRFCYQKYGLEELLVGKAEKITKEVNPLLYFLAIIDTIEPTKFFSSIKPECVWEKIKMELLDNNNNTIKITLMDNCLDTKGYYKKIKSLEDWIDVSVSIKDKEITIDTNGGTHA